MKITMYELLGMIKDGKAPKKIKWGDTKYILYINEDTKQTYYQDDECKYFLLNIKCLDDLNDEVEILEEEKKIPEKLKMKKTINGSFEGNPTYIYKYNEDEIGDTINKIIDYLKSKGE